MEKKIGGEYGTTMWYHMLSLDQRIWLLQSTSEATMSCLIKVAIMFKEVPQYMYNL